MTEYECELVHGCMSEHSKNECVVELSVTHRGECVMVRVTVCMCMYVCACLIASNVSVRE